MDGFLDGSDFCTKVDPQFHGLQGDIKCLDDEL